MNYRLKSLPILLAMSVLASAPVLALSGPVKRGDATGDGEVNVTDAIRVLNKALALESPNLFSDLRVEALGDVDGNNTLTVADVVPILRSSVGLEELGSVQPVNRTVNNLPATNVDAIRALETQHASVMSAYKDATRSEAERTAAAKSIFAQEGGLFQTAREIEMASGLTGLAGYVTAAFNNTGEPIAMRTQRVDKGITRILTYGMLQRIRLALQKLNGGDAAGAQRAVDEAWAFWQDIRGTALKREGNFPRLQNQLVPPVDQAFLDFASAVGQNQRTVASLEADFLLEKVAQIFYVATANYIRALAADVAAGNFTKAEEHRAEGESFLIIVQPIVQGTPGGEAVAARFGQPVTPQNSFTVADRDALLGQLNSAIAGYIGAPQLLQSSDF
ncbi:MAG: hypothetical protein KY468_03145 [Armatimonadetes bacterium]|nr:hypothetical protein [Armatimonadota bacterium]